jgi:arylsulfatase A-like enzyme
MLQNIWTTTVLLLLVVVGRLLGCGCGGVAAISSSDSSPNNNRKRPHILFIVADDLGYNDVGYHQNAKSPANPHGLPTTNAAAGILATPTLDRLAVQEGVRLEQYYVQPLCSPTRASIMTGRYPSHTGLGPDVDRIDWPVGVPASEIFFPQRLQDMGYATHMVGKWHLGACHEGYTPTFRGFDSYFGYLSGGQGYYYHGGDRNCSSCTNQLGTCLGPDSPYAYNYSSILFANEAIRIVEQHQHTQQEQPLFLYLAFQSVHNPYDKPPIDVDALFPEIVDKTRRIYAGMVTMLDEAVKRVVQAFQDKGLWDDTVLIFTSDNGGVGPGSNYPLRGTKVYNWEGGIKAVGFVRGTNNVALKPLPSGTVCNALTHATDWFLTVVEGVARSSEYTNNQRMPSLDGYNQWDVFAGRVTTNRTTIFHQVPVGAKPVKLGIDTNGKVQYTTSMCMHHVDPRITVPCSPFGVTGGAIRHDNWKLLITSKVVPAPWGDTSPKMEQIPPGGYYPNGTRVFVPPTSDSIPEPFQGQYYLFDIAKDPAETHNLAASMPEKLAVLLKVYEEYAVTAVPSLTWRWGFTDPKHNSNPTNQGDLWVSGNVKSSSNWERRSFLQEEDRELTSTAKTSTGLNKDGATQEEATTCMGPFLGSEYCAYGHEWECYVMGNDLIGFDLNVVHHSNTTAACQASCAMQDACQYWVLDLEDGVCRLKSAMGNITSNATRVFGPRECPK